MIRQHQFYKVELVSIVEPTKCIEELERMTDCATGILDSLELPYRKVNAVAIWVLAQRKLMILKFGCPQKIDIEKYHLAPLVHFSQQNESKI